MIKGQSDLENITKQGKHKQRQLHASWAISIFSADCLGGNLKLDARIGIEFSWALSSFTIFSIHYILGT